MGSSSPFLLLPFLFLSSILFFLTNPVSADEASNLRQGINSYRTSQNLTTLTENDNADCLAEQIADQFKNQPCTNTSGSSTVPGSEPQFSDYPNLLSACHLNVSDTRDGSIMPACVPNLDPTLVLNNFTKTQYSESLNDTKYTGIGIGSNGNWIVVILTTSTAEGSFVPYNAAGLITSMGPISHFLFLLLGTRFLL